MLNKYSLDNGDYVSWAAHSTNEQPQQSIIPSELALYPRSKKIAHSTCIMAHVMQMVCKAIHHLNPSQIPASVIDQPLFAICKQIQWTWKHRYGENKLVVMMGRLHIEINIWTFLMTGYVEVDE